MPRVLYIDHPEDDYVAALLYLGLCQVLGPENVVDWPGKDVFHGRVYTGPVPYGPNGTDIPGNVVPYPWFPAQPDHPWSNWSPEEMVARVGEFDAVVLASPRAYNVPRAVDLVRRVGRRAVPKLVVVDGEDYSTVRWDVVDALRPDVYFKTTFVPEPFEVYRDLKRKLAPSTRVVPLPLVTTLQKDIAPASKDVDFAFLGGNNWKWNRKEGVAVEGRTDKADLEAVLAREFPNRKIVLGNLPYEDYLSALARSRIAISVGGCGAGSIRTYEMMAAPDTLVLRERDPSIRPHPLVGGVNCVDFSTEEELLAALRRYLDPAHEAERSAIAQCGNALIREHYTPRARAQDFLSEILR